MEILVHLIQVIQVLIAGIIGSADVIQHIRRFIVSVVPGCGAVAYSHSSAEEENAVEEDLVGAVLLGPAVL